MELTTPVIVYLVIGAAHSVIWGLGSLRKYPDIWFVTPSLIFIMLFILAVLWPAMAIANLVYFGGQVTRKVQGEK